MSSVLSLFIAALVASTVSARPVHLSTSMAKRAEGEIKFGYEGNSGPNFWPDQCQDLEPGQSPIDIREGSADFQDGSLAVTLDPQCGALLTTKDGVKVTFNPDGTKPTFIPQGREDLFTVDDFHFHTPSEHHVGGKYFDAEMHVVGKAEDGTLSVLSVFFEVSESADKDTFMKVITDALPLKKDETFALDTLDFASIIEGTNQFTGFHTYTGSLTTPPCTKGVLWNIMDTPIPISLGEFKALRDAQGFNARFTQVARDEEPVFTAPKEEESEKGSTDCEKGGSQTESGEEEESAPEPTPEPASAPQPAKEPEDCDEKSAADPTPEPTSEPVPTPEPASEPQSKKEPKDCNCGSKSAESEEESQAEPTPEPASVPQDPKPEPASAPQPKNGSEDCDKSSEEESAADPTPEPASAPVPTPEPASAPQPAKEPEDCDEKSAADPTPEPTSEPVPTPEPASAPKPEKESEDCDEKSTETEEEQPVVPTPEPASTEPSPTPC